MSLFDGMKARREERKEERVRQEIVNRASTYTATTPSKDQEIEEIRRWEGNAAAAAALADRNAPKRYTPVSRTAPARVAYQPGSVAPTNTMAILALVFGVGGGLLGIVFGHIALSQIQRTGESGHGLAVSGLVLGYAGVAISLIYLLVVAGLVASLT